MIIVDVDCRAIAVAKKKFNKKSNQENKNQKLSKYQLI